MWKDDKLNGLQKGYVGFSKVLHFDAQKAKVRLFPKMNSYKSFLYDIKKTEYTA